MAYVRHSGPTNSTAFTTCCDVAICDYQTRCPVCREFIYPDREDDEKLGVSRSEHERGVARFNYAFGPFRRSRRNDPPT